ncbi:MAG TPA: M56 family metallopeptidase [Luteitalea sp.]|nr:M56 family metallopeptidase [Luteitalea sp.]
MNGLRTLVDAPVFLVVGWFVVLSLWATTMAAVGLMLWRVARAGREPRSQYSAASFALVSALLGSLALPVLLLATSSRASLPQQAPIRAVQTDGTGASHAAFPASATPTSSPLLQTTRTGAFTVDVPTRVLGVLGVGWMLGAAFCLGRLAVGWVAATRLSRDAVDVEEGVLRDAFDDLQAAAGVTGTRLAVSSAIDAPAAVGIRVPTILLPAHFLDRLPVDSLGPILSHELAHVARHDYRANLTQSLGEAVLFHSPATWWIGHRIRDAREFACDDRAVAAAGDRTRYVEALTLLAGLGAAAAPQPVVGMAGPRLITRVRRLLEGEPTMHAPVLRALATGICGLGLAAVLPVPFNLASAQFATRLLAAGQGQESLRVPIGFPQKQEGSALRIRRVDSTPTHACGTFDVQNVADVAVDRVRVVAVLSFAPGSNRPVQFVESDWIPLGLAPGASGRVEASLVDVAATLREAAGSHVQAHCALREVVYANQASWQATLNPLATSERDTFGLRQPALPRHLVGPTLAMAASLQTLCLDDAAAEYSPGAQIPIRDEPGRQARCTIEGRWVEVGAAADASPAALNTVISDAVTMELRIEGIPAAMSLKSAPGAVAAVQLPSGQAFGFVPERTTGGSVVVKLHDMSTRPHRLVATKVVGPDESTRFEEVDPVLTVRLRSR